MERHNRLKFPAAIAVSVLAGTIGTSLWLRAQLSDTRSVSSLMPPGALLYLEAKDFYTLLNEWNGSSEKRRWLQSKNYDILSRSRLIGRLSQAQDEFASVAGLPIGLRLLDQVAGERSGFAFYNLSNLKFVYITQTPDARIENSELWNSRTRYQSREVAGIPFYLRSDDAGQRTIAFASYKGWFVAATDENLMAETLALVSSQAGASLSTEPWFAETSRTTQKAGDLRLVYNLTALISTPQFRTYWLQRNASELRAFSSGISDLFESNDAFEEQRVLLRKQEMPVTEASLSDVLPYAPETSSLYRAWGTPDRNRLAETIQQVIFGEQISGPVMFNQPAPAVTPESGAVGSEADLEIRIDEPPFQRAGQNSADALVNAIASMQPTALLHVQTTTVIDDQVFVLPNSGVVIVCRQPDQAALNQALSQTAGLLQTGSLDPLHASVDGKIIELSRLNLSRSARTATLPAGATYAAQYRHTTEGPHYKKLFAILDRGAASSEASAVVETSQFFSGNLESIGDSLYRLRSASIVSLDQGSLVRETVRYELAQP